MKQKNNITLLVIGVLTLLVAIVGAAYAYFSSSITPGSGLNLDVEAQANTAQFTASGGQFGFTVTGAEMQQANAGNLAKEATGSINVSLTSPKIAMCTFDVAFAWNSGSSYTATSGRGSQFEFGVLYEGNPYGAINNAIKPINFDTLISNGGKVLEDAKIIINEANGTSKTTNITLNFKVQMYNLNHDQSSLAGSSSKTYSGRFYVTNVDCQENKLYLNDVILASNEIYPDSVASTYVTSSTGINFGNPSSDTNGKGVYYTNQNTENNDYTYYFRGDVKNNYVKFGQEIIRSCTYNGADVEVWDDMLGVLDIYTKTDCEQQLYLYEGRYVTAGIYGFLGDEGFEEVNGGYATYNEVKIDSYWQVLRINENDSIKLIYYGTEVDTPSVKELIRSGNRLEGEDLFSQLSDWFDLNYDKNPILAQVSSTDFCYDGKYAGAWEENDIPDGIIGDVGTTSYYQGYERIVMNQTPKYKCFGDVMNYNVGLITADEAVYAGASVNETNNSIFIKRNTEYTLETQSHSGIDANRYFSITSDGKLYSNGFSTDSDGMPIVPVINLRSDIKITDGTGTKTDPYIINLD